MTDAETPTDPAAPPELCEDASDLFGYPPKEPVTCDRCGDEDVEPYHGKVCWKCHHVRQAWAAYRSWRTRG